MQRLKLFVVLASAALALTLTTTSLSLNAHSRARPATAISLSLPYTQDFSTLATSGTSNAWTDDSTLNGWYST